MFVASWALAATATWCRVDRRVRRLHGVLLHTTLGPTPARQER